MIHFSRAFLPGLVWLSAGCCPLLFAQAAVVISEVAHFGTTGACSNGNDWVELHNNGTQSVNLTGWVLHDDKGASHQNAFTVPQLDPLPPAAFLLLCTQVDSDDVSSPQFAIGATDTITLIDTSAGAGNEQVASQVKLTGEEDARDVTYALDETDGKYKYTITPTPGMANRITPVPTMQERMIAQNAEGTKFFNMDSRGLPVPDGMDEVLELHITMEESDYQDLMQNATYQLYSPFTSARVVGKKKSAVASQQDNVIEEEEVLLNLTSPGRIRSKGQYSLVSGICLNMSIPFLLDFDRVNSSQKLFGLERLYLRTHFQDSSFMREWVVHRMLARFGLPHLRARTVRFFINEKRIGLYTALEAVDQDYVFYRSFPTVNFDNYALYKVKTMSRKCGTYDDNHIAAAEARLNVTPPPPYVYETGDHREKIPVLGPDKVQECKTYFLQDMLVPEFEDVILAYLRFDRDCGAMLVSEGIVDRDLGRKQWDPVMAKFINEHLADNKCDKGCQNSNLAAEVDVDNFLKNFAVYAVALIQDSPMGTGNNYYLADRGAGTAGWNIVAYDQNTPDASSCSDTCEDKLVHWSIVRPTCASLESNQIVGPLLTNAALHAKYIDYVRLFVDNVIGNTSFYEQIQQHGLAIKEDAATDAWGEGGLYFQDNLSHDPTLWNKNGRYPLLPLYIARVNDVRKQLEALDAGTFPRGPHLDTPVESEEVCVDWRSKGANDSGTSDNGGEETDNTSAGGSLPSRHFQLIVWVTTTFISAFLFF